MKTTVNGRNYNVTEDQKLKIAKKLERFDKFFGDDAHGNAVLRRTKHGEIVEITLSAGGMLYRSEVEDTTWINALDRAVEHIERQIRKTKHVWQSAYATIPSVSRRKKPIRSR